MELFYTPGDLATIIFIFIVGAIISIKIGHRFYTTSKRSLLIYIWHSLFCVIYAVYSLHNTADALGYYKEALAGDVSFSLGTAAVNYISFFLAQTLGLSYLSVFLIYNICGTIGLLAFDASLQIAIADKSRKIRLIATLIVFLPSVSFWSSALGKDSLSFMATGIALWAAINLKRRVWLIIISIITMLLVRPHIAGIMVLALAAAQIVQRRVPLTQRLILGSLAISASVIMVPFALNYAGVKGDNAKDIASYIDQRQQENLEGGSSIDIASMSLPMQLFTYLFRPLPFEANNIFSLASSIDNLVLICLFISGGWAILKKRRKHRQKLIGSRTFLWFYSAFAWVILAVTTANMGIAARQKWMFVPMLIFLLISHLGKSKLKRAVKGETTTMHSAKDQTSYRPQAFF